MTRLRILAAHVLALPLSVIVSIALSTALARLKRQHGIDVSLQDTFYVVAHFHPTEFLVVFLAVSALIVRAYGAPTRWLWAACGVGIIHLGTAMVVSPAWVEVSSRDVYVFTDTLSSFQRVAGYGFLASGVLAFGCGLVALGASAVAALRAVRANTQRRAVEPGAPRM